MPIRLLVALVVLGALFYFVGIDEFVEVLYQVDLFYLVLLTLLSIVMIWASCLKWQLFIRSAGPSVSMWHLMRLYTVGYFFNTFTPSYVGGDLARSYHLGKYMSSQRDALIATFLERFTGLLAMALLGVLFVLIGAEATVGLSTAILLVGAGALVLAVACFSPHAGEMLFRLADSIIGRLGTHGIVVRLRAALSKLNNGLIAARGNPKLLGKALLLSLFFHCLTVINTYVAARAIGWEDPGIGGLFIVVPLVLLVSMAPITPAGLGIQEGAFLFLLQRVGASEPEALAVGILLRVKVLLLGVLGGLLWVQLKREPASKKAADLALIKDAEGLH
jgi:uncharacterized protein (TIRG00374 family)